jgi:hypothetical protein
VNPWAGVIIIIAILFFIIAWKGTQDNVLSAVLNRPYQGSSSASTTANTGTAAVNLAATPTAPAAPWPPLQGTTNIGGLPVGQA